VFFDAICQVDVIYRGSIVQFMGVHNRKKQYGFASVNPRDAQIVNKEKSKKVIIISFVVVLLLILTGSVFAISKMDIDLKSNIANIAEVFKRDEKVSDEGDLPLNIEIKDSSVKTVPAVVSGGKKTVEKVKLALLASPDLFDYRNNEVVGCDALVFAQAEIPATPKVLNSTLALLFTDKFDYGFPPANFISSTQKDLSFDFAIIENGVAKVFLKGETTIENATCDEDRIGYQIRETSKQFPTVKTVEIYLDGIKTEL
jgi:hypothetical protein